MDGGNARKRGFPVSIRSLILVIAVFALLTVSVAWNVRQSRREQNAIARAIAAEKAATQAQANAEEAQRKRESLRDEAVKRAARRYTKEDAERSRQLVEEIDSLTHIQAQIQEGLYKIQRPHGKTGRSPDPGRTPRSSERRPGAEGPTGGRRSLKGCEVIDSR